MWFKSSIRSQKKAWNLKDGDVDTLPSYDNLIKFLNSRARALEECAASSPTKSNKKSAQSSRVSIANAMKGSKSACSLCQAPHLLFACSEFLGKNANERREIIKKQKRCFNCLSAKHSVAECKSKYTCRVCQQKHHSLLQFASINSDSCSNAKNNDVLPNCSSPQNLAEQSLVASHLAPTAVHGRSQVLLATAWVTIRGSSGRIVTVRALLDQGSEMTFISEHLAQSLHAKRSRIWISPRDYLSPSFNTNALIMKSLTPYTEAPSRRIIDFISF